VLARTIRLEYYAANEEEETAMSSNTIRASVGMSNNGTTNCYNQPADVATIVKLLNQVSATDGGASVDQLPSAPTGQQLYRAIRRFQQVQNDLGRTPRLSVDGHVDPGAPTLARLVRLAGGAPLPGTKTRILHSIATMSWIDQRLYDPEDLPEVDKYNKTPDYVVRQTLLANTGYRFVNFLEAYIEVDDQQKIVDHDFTPDSKMYYGPSFRGFMPTAFPVKTDSTVSDDGNSVTFSQTVGCKTHSPETIGQKQAVKTVDGILGITPGWGGPIGGQIEQQAAELGEKVAQNFRVFPPIWTTLELTISSDGGFTGELVAHSLFPSNSFYQQKYSVELLTYNTTNYELMQSFDGRPNIDEWRKKGWGAMHVYPSGPSGGNPWGVPDPRFIAGHDIPIRPSIPPP